MLMFLGHLHFKLIESLSIDSNDVCLRDECFGVYFVYNAEDRVALTTLCHDKEHLHFVTGIETMSLNDRGTTMWKDGDAEAISLYLSEMMKNCTLRCMMFTTWSTQ